MRPPVAAYWALIAVCFFWGTTYIAIRIGVQQVQPFLFAGIRFLLAGVLATGYALLRGQAFPNKRELKQIALIALMLLTIGNGTLAWAEQWVPVGVASLIIVSTPFWMVAFARAGGETISARALLGLVIGFFGLVTVLWPELRKADPNPDFLRGAGGLVFSSAMWAYGSVYSKRHPLKTRAWMKMGLQMLFAGLYLSVLGLLCGEWAVWAPTASVWWSILYLTVFGSLVGYGCYMYALERLPTEQVSIYAYVNPIVAIILGVIILNETVDPFLVVGSPLVLCGIYLVNSRRRLDKKAPAVPDARRTA